MQWIKCLYCGLKCIGIKNTSLPDTYNVVDENSNLWYGVVVTNIEYLDIGTKSESSIGLVNTLGTKPQKITIEF